MSEQLRDRTLGRPAVDCRVGRTPFVRVGLAHGRRDHSEEVHRSVLVGPVKYPRQVQRHVGADLLGRRLAEGHPLFLGERLVDQRQRRALFVGQVLP